MAATAVTPMALAAKQPGAYHASSNMESNTRVAPSEFIIFSWGSMPIAPANGPWGDLADTNDMLKDLFDCGFNTSGFTRNVEILRDIRNNHLVSILRVGINTNQEVTQEEADNHIRKVIESITDPEDRKAIHAIYIRDEPNASLFPRLNIWSEAIKKQGFLPYINLYPDAVLPEWLGTKDYEEHLDQYVEICDPPYISYDNYSLFEGGRLDEDRFFGNIEAIRHKSLQAGIPFWNVILANAHFKYAEPSDATFAIQVYSTLAYGGRGIGYFTYYTPQVGNYRLSPIDRFGYRTKTWGMMRNINLQVHSLAPVYCQLKSVNVFHTGHIVRNGRGIETAKLVESISSGSLVVGEFAHPDGKPYVMVVNKDVHSSIEFDIEFKKKGKIMIVSQFNQGRVPFQGEQKWLSPGCGVLLTIE